MADAGALPHRVPVRMRRGLVDFYLIRVAAASPQGTRLGDVEIFRRDADRQLVERLTAAEAVAASNGQMNADLHLCSPIVSVAR